MKHLADLRNRANSQRSSSIYEDRRPKIEDIERSDGKKSLKDNKVPGTCAGTKASEAPSPDAGTAAGLLAESQGGLCEQPGACLDQWGLNRKNFSKRTRENRGTQRLVRELSRTATLSSASPPSALGL